MDMVGMDCHPNHDKKGFVFHDLKFNERINTPCIPAKGV
jgi:hypothetical protein